jgi:sugar/nucleoside kinase (ribokinase family)
MSKRHLPDASGQPPGLRTVTTIDLTGSPTAWPPACSSSDPSPIPTAHIVHLVEPGAHRRYVEHPGANAALNLTATAVAAHCANDTYALLSTALPLAVARTAASSARAAGATVVIAGPDGNLVATRDDRRIRLPHLPAETVDPTGGGDAFIGTLTALLAAGEPLEDTAQLASAAAADTISRLGGRPRFDRAGLLRRLRG